MSLRPLIIDTDPGGDDAQAIMLLSASGEYDIRAICAVHGNVGLEHTRRNALYLKEVAGLQCPVSAGAPEAILARIPRAAYAHGNNGLSGLEFEVDESKLSNKHPWDIIYDEALHWGGELEVFAVGPLTNIALTLLRHPDLPRYVKQLTVMGGALTRGNTSPYAEFNIAQDPHAMQICLAAGFKQFVICDLDFCRKCYITYDEASCFDQLPYTNPWAPLYRKFAQRQRERKNAMTEEQRKKMGFPPGFGPCDAATAFAMTYPEKCTFKEAFCVCETRSSISAGQTLFDFEGRFGKEPNVLLAVDVDRDAYGEFYVEMLHRFDEGGLQ